MEGNTRSALYFTPEENTKCRSFRDPSHGVCQCLILFGDDITLLHSTYQSH